MFAAGPFWSDDGEYWEGEGMVLIRAASFAEAQEIAASDPMHKSGARTFRIRPWLVNEGALAAASIPFVPKWAHAASFSLTAGSSHAPIIPWVGTIKDHVVPEST